MIARGTAGLVLAPAMLEVVVGAAVLAFEDMRLSFLTVPLAAAFVFFLFFFRDPRRAVGPGVVSPADGRVLSADPEDHEVTIFMGVTDVHVNRAPLGGRVVTRIHRAGRHRIASTPDASDNERVEWEFATVEGPLRLDQIAGAFARRIVPYARPGDRVRKGQRIGIVRFGSRVRVVVPPRARIVIRPGDRVRAGETTLAELPR